MDPRSVPRKKHCAVASRELEKQRDNKERMAVTMLVQQVGSIEDKKRGIGSLERGTAKNGLVIRKAVN